MKKIKVIITGATGMVGEGVLLHCLQSDDVSEVMMINRRSYDMQHPKLKELLVKDFNDLAPYAVALKEYDACFFCAGISSVGLNEADYTRITYDMTLRFAAVLQQVAPQMVFTYVSGVYTNSTGKQMWQRVKGRTEQALMQQGFAGQYNFRPGFMKPVQGQRNIRWFFKPLIAIFPLLLPKKSLTLQQVGQAMIHAVTKGYTKQILEIEDIKILAAE